MAVDIARLRPVYVMGEVRAPGSYEYHPNLTVLNAAALAGGFTYRANRKKVDITREDANNVQTVHENVLVSAPVRPGDVIIVQERFF